MFKTFVSSLACLGAALTVTPAAANDWPNRVVGETQSDSRSCFFFSLVGVAEADGAVPNQIWFTVPTSNVNYQVIVSTVLSGKIANRPLHVRTDGTVSCGYATASTVGLQ